jgi:hypothetical protein
MLQAKPYARRLLAPARKDDLAGDQWAYLAGIMAVLLGAVLVFFLFPKRDEERKMLAEFHAEDTNEAGAAS